MSIPVTKFLLDITTTSKNQAHHYKMYQDDTSVFVKDLKEGTDHEAILKRLKKFIEVLQFLNYLLME